MVAKIRSFKIDDYKSVRGLWERSGLEIRPGDGKAEVRTKTTRDPELFLVAEEDDRIVGTVMGAWDGRRGWLYHLGVLPEYQRTGLATALVAEAEKRMKAKGVIKVNAHVIKTNAHSRAFFEKAGYTADKSLVFYGKYLNTRREGNARR